MLESGGHRVYRACDLLDLPGMYLKRLKKMGACEVFLETKRLLYEVESPINWAAWDLSKDARWPQG